MRTREAGFTLTEVLVATFVIVIGLVAVAASVYIVLILEILKLRRVREWMAWRRESEARRERRTA